MIRSVRFVFPAASSCAPQAGIPGGVNPGNPARLNSERPPLIGSPHVRFAAVAIRRHQTLLQAGGRLTGQPTL